MNTIVTRPFRILTDVQRSELLMKLSSWISRADIENNSTFLDIVSDLQAVHAAASSHAVPIGRYYDDNRPEDMIDPKLTSTVSMGVLAGTNNAAICLTQQIERGFDFIDLLRKFAEDRGFRPPTELRLEMGEY